MIKIEIMGNKGEGTIASAEKILETLYMQRETGHIFIVDESDFVKNIKYKYPLCILDNTENVVDIKDVFKNVSKTDEKIFCIKKKCDDKDFEEIKKYMQEIADNDYEGINYHHRTYCIYFKKEI
jgi:hypothetical protein